MMKTATIATIATTVAGHAALIGIGPKKCRQAPRQPLDGTRVDKTSGTDGGQTNLQGLRCVSAHNDSDLHKIQNWCKDTGAWDNRTRDEGFCFGTTPNTFTSDLHPGLKESDPKLWGNDKECTWEADDIIEVSVHVTQQHKGTHFVDFIPQNAEQLVGLPPCPGSKGPDGKVAPFTPVDKRIEEFQVCYQDNVNVADGAGATLEDWQRKTIRLHPAFALHFNEQEATKSDEYQMKFYSVDGPEFPTDNNKYRLKYQFKLPNLKYDATKPALFRWVWTCGFDVQCSCTPSNATWMKDTHQTSGATCPHDDYVQTGMGEIFINCADVAKVTSSTTNTTTVAQEQVEAQPVHV